MSVATKSNSEPTNKSTQIQVVLSGGNIAHYHHTALALQEAGYLQKYFCVFFGENDFGIFRPFLPIDWHRRLQAKFIPGLERKRVVTISWPYLLTRLLQQAGWFSQEQADARYGNWFDAAIQRNLPPCDVFHFVHGVGLETARNARKRGCFTICDIRSGHIDAQERLLQEEYQELGLHYDSVHALYRERLIAEYEISDALILPSQYVADTFTQQGMPQEKMYVIPYGVDLSRFGGWLANETAPNGNKQQPFRVVFVGNVFPLKGLHYLVEAFQKLKLPDSEMLVVGVIDPAYRAVLDRMFSQANIRYLGRIPQVDLWRYYQQSSVFVMPSLSDSFGLVVAEAMAAGLPVIVSENTGAKEMVRQEIDGFIVPTRDVTTLQEKLQWLYDHPQEREMMGKQAARQAEQFTWERYRQRLLSVYDHLLSQ